jgi:hypothetical protein
MARLLFPWAHQALHSRCSSSSSSGVHHLATPQALLRLVFHQLASMLCKGVMLRCSMLCKAAM